MYINIPDRLPTAYAQNTRNIDFDTDVATSNTIRSNGIFEKTNRLITQALVTSPNSLPPSPSLDKKTPTLYRRILSAMHRRPKMTIISSCIATSIGAACLTIASAVAIIAGAAFLTFGLTIATFKILSMYRRMQQNQLFRAINHLELAGVFTTYGSVNLKKDLKHAIPNNYSEVFIQLTNKLKANKTLTEVQSIQLKELLKKDKIDQFLIQLDHLVFCDTQKNNTQSPLSITKNVHKYVDKLENSDLKIDLFKDLKENNTVNFQAHLVSYLRKMAEKDEKEKNHVSKYSHLELANKFTSLSESEVYIAFVRMMSFKEKFNERYNSLMGIVLSLGQINNVMDFQDQDQDQGRLLSELNTLKNNLHSLYTDCSALLSNYQLVNKKVDYLYASCFGSFNKNFKLIDDLLSEIETKISKKEEHLHAFCNGCHYTKLTPNANGKLVPTVHHSEFPLDLGKNTHVADKQYLSVAQNQQMDELTKLNAINIKRTHLQKKSILINTCSYGTGHNRAAEAIAKQIGQMGSHVSIFDPTDPKTGVYIKDIDIPYRVGKLFGAKWSSTQALNWILKTQNYWMINFWSKTDLFFRKLFRINGKHGVSAKDRDQDTLRKELFRKRLLMERPDMVVTTYHMDLNSFVETCEEMGIPLLHCPTDFDVKADEICQNGPIEYKHFKSFLPDENDVTWSSGQPFLNAHLNFEEVDGKRKVAGIPLRPEFYKVYSSEEKQKIKAARGIDPEAKVVLVLSGGNGQEVPFPYDLMNSENNGKKYHMIVVAGSNNAAGDKLNALKKAGQRFITGTNPNVTVEVAENTVAGSNTSKYFIGPSELSSLNAIADAAITKSGGLSIAELLQTGVPMLFDRRIPPMYWEDYNIDVIRQKGRGHTYEHEGFIARIRRSWNKTKSSHFIEKLDSVIKLGTAPKEDNSAYFTQEIATMLQDAEQDSKLSDLRKMYDKKISMNI